METIQHLKPETVGGLQELVQINLDSAEGFKTAASHVEDQAVQNLFNHLSGERSQFVGQLKTFIRGNGKAPQDSGTLKGQVHRWWMDLRSTLSGDDLQAMLSEAERGEDRIKSRYEKVILETSGSPVNDVLHAQYAKVKSAHDKIHALRDLAKESK